jgi:hypothetical protein
MMHGQQNIKNNKLNCKRLAENHNLENRDAIVHCKIKQKKNDKFYKWKVKIKKNLEKQ